MRHLLLAASIFQVSRVKLLPQMPLLPDPFHFGLLSKCPFSLSPQFSVVPIGSRLTVI